MALASCVRDGIGIPRIRSLAARVALPSRRRVRGVEGPEKRPRIVTHAGADRNRPGGRATPRTRGRHAPWLALLALLAPPWLAAPAEEPVTLLVQPPALRDISPGFDPRPLAQLISRALDRPVRVALSDDALGHWQRVRAEPDYALAFDEAHFVDYRIRRHGFTALVREADDVRFSLLVRRRNLVSSPSELAGQVVAVAAPPSLGALRLMGLFPRVARAPRLHVRDTARGLLEALRRGEAEAALLPVDVEVASREVEVALVTDLSPGRALSVSPAISGSARDAITRVLTGAGDPARAGALAAIAVTGMESTSNARYEDSERLLRGTWGYR